MSPSMTASIPQLVIIGGLGLASALAWPHAWSGRHDEEMDHVLPSCGPTARRHGKGLLGPGR
jgi:hypothetical protein